MRFGRETRGAGGAKRKHVLRFASAVAGVFGVPLRWDYSRPSPDIKVLDWNSAHVVHIGKSC